MIMFLQLVNISFLISTKGVDFKSKSMTIDDITFKMQLWDTCG